VVDLAIAVGLVFVVLVLSLFLLLFLQCHPERSEGSPARFRSVSAVQGHQPGAPSFRQASRHRLGASVAWREKADIAAKPSKNSAIEHWLSR